MMTGNEIRNCEEALRVLAAHLDGELDGATYENVERHLAKCRSCYSRAEFERLLKQQVRALAREPVAAPLADRIRSMIAGFPVSHAD